jgi:hypothetical protein
MTTKNPVFTTVRVPLNYQSNESTYKLLNKFIPTELYSSDDTNSFVSIDNNRTTCSYLVD